MLTVIAVIISTFPFALLLDQISCAVSKCQLVIACGVNSRYISFTVIFITGDRVLTETDVIKVSRIGISFIDTSDTNLLGI